MVVPFSGILGELQAESTVECSQVGKTVRLEQRVGLRLPIFDLVQRDGTTRRVAECRQVSRMKPLKTPCLKWVGRRPAHRHLPGRAQGRLSLLTTQPFPRLGRGVLEGLGQKAADKRPGQGNVRRRPLRRAGPATLQPLKRVCQAGTGRLARRRHCGGFLRQVVAENRPAGPAGPGFPLAAKLGFRWSWHASEGAGGVAPRRWFR